MKLANVIKPGAMVEFLLLDGTQIVVNNPQGSIYELETLDDGTQQLGFIVVLTQGRRKGEKGRMVVPYTAIKSVAVL